MTKLVIAQTPKCVSGKLNVSCIIEIINKYCFKGIKRQTHCYFLLCFRPSILCFWTSECISVPVTAVFTIFLISVYPASPVFPSLHHSCSLCLVPPVLFWQSPVVCIVFSFDPCLVFPISPSCVSLTRCISLSCPVIALLLQSCPTSLCSPSVCMCVGIHGFPFKIKENFALFTCVFRMNFFFSFSLIRYGST